jgi:hypothetical protein
MRDFWESWNLCRGRLVDSFADLNQQQLNWRLHPGTLTIGEMALHVAGAEINFVTQLLGVEPEGLSGRLKKAATDSIVNDEPFPFAPEEITPQLLQESFALAREIAERHIEDPSPEIRERRIKSVLGPIIDGTGAFARLAFHPAYHQGQVHVIRTAPGFPA